jgi:ATP-binding protein involved in chromosome partitioning
VSPDAKIKINSKVETPEKAEIKGKSIPGIKNIIAVASGKGGKIYCNCKFSSIFS